MEILRITTEDARFLDLVRELDAELRLDFGDLMDFFAPQNHVKGEKAVVAVLSGSPVGCGCFKKFDAVTIEVKRVFVKPEFRRQGIAEALMVELQNFARDEGFERAVLETGKRLKGARALYQRLGYSQIDNYPPYVGQAESVCLERSLEI